MADHNPPRTASTAKAERKLLNEAAIEAALIDDKNTTTRRLLEDRLSDRHSDRTQNHPPTWAAGPIKTGHHPLFTTPGVIP